MFLRDTTNLSLFQKLQDDLAAEIQETPPGERLLSEPELAVKLGVSRTTLREAMRMFEGQGLIRRRQGVGTFVVDPKLAIESSFDVLESIETQAHRLGMNVVMGYHENRVDLAGEELAKKFGFSPTTLVQTVSRSISIGERPVAYLVDTVPASILAQTSYSKGVDFNGSILDLLIKEQAVPVSHSEAIFTAVPASQIIAKRLQLQRGDPILKLDGLLFDLNNQVIDISQSYYVPGFYKFRAIRQIHKG